MGAPSGGLQSRGFPPRDGFHWSSIRRTAALQAPSAGGSHRGSLRGVAALLAPLAATAGTRAPGGLQSRGLPLASTDFGTHYKARILYYIIFHKLNANKKELMF